MFTCLFFSDQINCVSFHHQCHSSRIYWFFLLLFCSKFSLVNPEICGEERCLVLSLSMTFIELANRFFCPFSKRSIKSLRWIKRNKIKIYCERRFDNIARNHIIGQTIRSQSTPLLSSLFICIVDCQFVPWRYFETDISFGCFKSHNLLLPFRCKSHPTEFGNCVFFYPKSSVTKCVFCCNKSDCLLIQSHASCYLYTAFFTCKTTFCA